MTDLAWIRNESTLQNHVQVISSARLQPAFARVQELDCGLPIIRFLCDHPKTLITSEGIAAELGRAIAPVRASLAALEELGLVRRAEAAGTVFYGLGDPADRKLARALLAQGFPLYR